jgi:glycosyltransferase involved in cell wall biosynthesis
MRVLHLPTSVGGNPNGLSLALRQLGVDSKTLTINRNYLNYPTDESITNPKDKRLLRIIKQLYAFKYVFGRYDIIHFNAGSSLFSTRFSGVDFSPKGLSKVLFNLILSALQLLELSILRCRRIPLFIHYQGDDARQGDYSLRNYEISIATEVGEEYYSCETDKRKRNQIALFDRFCAKIYSVNPDLLDVLPSRAEFIPYGHIDLSEFSPSYLSLGSVLRIGHAPTHREAKGSSYIISALETLREEGFQFELVLVEGHSNLEALSIYKSCHIVIDQVLAGWYGGLAVESMALGKPVVAFIRDSDLLNVPEGIRRDLPIIRVNKNNLVDDLRKVLQMDNDQLLGIAKDSRRYVEKWHDSRLIAGKILSEYKFALQQPRKKS